ncbi:MAG: YheU family protein [Desulfuromonadaceae bacterium]
MNDSRNNQIDRAEEGVEIPLEQINPDTLRNMVAEFVTREWADLGDSDYTLDDEIAQVLKQLHDNRAKVVFDLTSESWNIVTKEL